MKVNACRLFLLTIITLVMFVRCGPDHDSDIAPDTKAMLTTGTWKIKTATVDGVDKSNLFTNFTISFSASGYTAVNGSAVWPPSGTWSFVNADQKAITRNDGVVVSVEDVSETALTLKLTWNKTTLGSGRTTSVQGGYTFVFGK